MQAKAILIIHMEEIKIKSFRGLSISNSIITNANCKKNLEGREYPPGGGIVKILNIYTMLSCTQL